MKTEQAFSFVIIVTFCEFQFNLDTEKPQTKLTEKVSELLIKTKPEVSTNIQAPSIRVHKLHTE